jgi:hypothetical protein
MVHGDAGQTISNPEAGFCGSDRRTSWPGDMHSMKQTACFTLTTVNGGKMIYLSGSPCPAVPQAGFVAGAAVTVPCASALVKMQNAIAVRARTLKT